MSMKEILGIKLYEVDEVAKMLEMTERTIKSHISEGIIKGTKVGRKFYVAEKSIIDYFYYGGELVRRNDDKEDSTLL